MILSIVLLLIPLWNYYIGYRRGIILQTYYTIAWIASFLIAQFQYKKVVELATLWIPYANPTQDSKVYFWTSVDIFSLDQVFYNGVSFLGVMVLAYAAFRLIGILVHLFNIDAFRTGVTKNISGVLNLLMTFSFLSLLFSVVTTIPMDLIQNICQSNGVINFLVNQVPGLSSLIESMWTSGLQ